MDREDSDYRFTLRVPSEVYRALKRVADRQQRSVQGQVIWCLLQNTDVADEMERERKGPGA